MNDTTLNIPGIIAPPPVMYLTAILISLLMHFLYPLIISHHTMLLRSIGVVSGSASVMLVSYAFLTMRQAKTSPNPYALSAALVTVGPFRFSRNPIYLAMTMLYLAVTFIINSSWPLFFLLPLQLLMHYGVIVREERYLESRFGDSYREYKFRVRRWL